MREIAFKSVEIQSGGTLEIDTGGLGMKMTGDNFTIHSGGLFNVDKLHLITDTLHIDTAGILSANGKVITSDSNVNR